MIWLRLVPTDPSPFVSRERTARTSKRRSHTSPSSDFTVAQRTATSNNNSMPGRQCNTTQRTHHASTRKRRKQPKAHRHASANAQWQSRPPRRIKYEGVLSFTVPGGHKQSTCTGRRTRTNCQARTSQDNRGRRVTRGRPKGRAGARAREVVGVEDRKWWEMLSGEYLDLRSAVACFSTLARVGRSRALLKVLPVTGRSVSAVGLPCCPTQLAAALWHH